jgi:hypothetical protein
MACKIDRLAQRRSVMEVPEELEEARISWQMQFHSTPQTEPTFFKAAAARITLTIPDGLVPVRAPSRRHHTPRWSRTRQRSR